MASKLFASIVVASTLLLSGTLAVGCASTVSGNDAGAADGALAEDSSAAHDASSPDDADGSEAVDAALGDERADEAGWPTTKGVYCRLPEGAAPPALECCRHTLEHEERCCAVPSGASSCEPCPEDTNCGGGASDAGAGDGSG